MADYAPLSHVVGRVGIAPTEKIVNSKGEQVTLVTFSVAVPEGYGPDAKTNWFNCAVWNTELQPRVLAEVYKGATVAVEGPLKERVLDNGTTSHDISAFRVGLVEWIVKGKAKPKDDQGGDDF